LVLKTATAHAGCIFNFNLLAQEPNMQNSSIFDVFRRQYARATELQLCLQARKHLDV
jgi:hypothetical protein